MAEIYRCPACGEIIGEVEWDDEDEVTLAEPLGPKCPYCRILLAYAEDRDQEGNLLLAWWECPDCDYRETARPPLQTPAEAACDGGDADNCIIVEDCVLEE